MSNSMEILDSDNFIMKTSDMNTIISKKIVSFEKNGTCFKFLIRCVKYNYEKIESETDSDDYFYYIDQIEGKFNPPFKNEYNEEIYFIGGIVSKNFFTTKMLDIVYSKDISLRNKKNSIKKLLEQVTKVPKDRIKLAFHSITSENYPSIAKEILKSLNLKIYKTNEDIQIFILKTLCEYFWD